MEYYKYNESAMNKGLIKEPTTATTMESVETRGKMMI
jgi:hypothetical protein